MTANTMLYFFFKDLYMYARYFSKVTNEWQDVVFREAVTFHVKLLHFSGIDFILTVSF